MGRPRKYKTPEELETKIDEYFASDAGQTKPTLEGLILDGLGFRHLEALTDYSNYSIQFSEVVKKAYTLHRKWLAERILETGKQIIGPIFTLKHHHNWRDNQQIQVDANINIKVTDYSKSKAE